MDMERPTNNHDVDVKFLFTHLDEIRGVVEIGRFEGFCVVRVLELGTATFVIMGYLNSFAVSDDTYMLRLIS